MRTAKTLLHAFVAVSMVFSTVATALLAVPATANAQSIGYPTSIGFQGRLKNSSGQAIASGTYDFRFRFFDSSDAAATSDYIYVDDITVTNGFFSAPIPLGADIADFVNELELEVGTVASSGAGSSTPADYETFGTRITMYKAPYSVFTQGIQNSASDPSNPYAGRIYYNTSNGELKVYDGSSWDTMADTLDKAYDNFGSAAQIITVDDATTGIEFSVEAAGNMTVDLQDTGDFVIQDAGSTWAQFTDGQSFIVNGTSAITLDADAASNFNTSSGDLGLAATAGSVNINGAEAAADAVNIDASNAAGGIDIDAGTAGITIDTTGAFSFDGAGTASNISLASDGAGDDLTISVTGATDSSLVLSSSGTGTDAIDINATAGGVDIDAAGASSFTTAAGDLTLLADTGSVVIKGDEGVTDAILFDADTTSGSGIYFDAYDASNNTSGNITMDARTFDINLTGSSTSHGLDVDVSGSGAPVSLTTTDGDISLTAGGSTGDITITSQASDIAIETSTASKTINIGSTNFARTVNISTGTGNDSVNIANNGTGTKNVVIGNNTGSSALDLNAGSGAIDMDTGGGEIQIDGGLTDIGGGTYTVADGDNDLGVEGDLEINGVATVVDLTVESGARIGTGSTPDSFTALDDDTLFVEGAFEVDGTARFDGVITATADVDFDAVGGGAGDPDFSVDGYALMAGTLDLNGTVDADVSDFDVLSTAGFSLDASGTASNISQASNSDADDLTISLTGANDASVILSSSGTGADAISLIASAGGVNVDLAAAMTIDGHMVNIGGVTAGTVDGDNDLGVAGDVEVDGVADFDGSVDADVTDFDANSSGGIQLTAAATSADAIDIHSTGTVAGTALNLETTNGAIEIDANGVANGDLIFSAEDDVTMNIAASGAVVNLFDNAFTKTIHVGGVDADSADTVAIAVEGTSADTISIGNTNASTTLALQSGNWQMANTGVLTLSPTASQTTGLVVTDSDFTNALSVGTNNIIGSTGSINYTNFQLTGADGAALFAGGDFDVDASGNITDVSNIISDGDLTVTGGDITGNNGDGIEIGNVDSTYVLELNSDATATLTTSDSVDGNTPLTITTAGTGALTLDTGAAGAIALGSADVTGITFTTDNNAANDLSFTGGATFNDDVTFSLGTGEEFTLTKTATDAATEEGVHISYTAGAGDGGDFYRGLLVDVTSANHSAASDNVRGIAIGNLSSADVDGTEIALDIGSGWDADIYFSDTSAVLAVPGPSGSTITFLESDSSSALMTITENSNEGDVTITGELVADGFTGTAAQDLTISSGAATASNGRTLGLVASPGVGDGNTGGNITLTSGAGVTHSSTGNGSDGGDITITGGIGGDGGSTGATNGGNGGDIFLTPGGGGSESGGGLNGISGSVRISAPSNGASGNFKERLCTDLVPSGSPGDGEALSNARLGDCDNTAQADYAEMYPTAENVDYGHVVVPGTELVETYDTSHGHQVITQTVLSSEPYQTPIVGIVSNNYGDPTSAGYNIDEEDRPMPVALVGRVPVKVVAEGGEIRTGDFVTTSSTPGYAMRATESGRVIGMALADWDGVSDTVMVQVVNSWYTAPVSEASSLQGGSATQVTITESVSVATSAFTGSISVAEHLYGSRDMAGRARLNAGDDHVRVTFETEYQHLPIVTFSVRTQEHVPGRLWISDEDTTGFTINHSAGNSTPYEIEFNWIAVGVEEAIVSISNGETEEVTVTVTSDVAAEAAATLIAEQTSEDTSEEEATSEEEVVEESSEEEEAEEPASEEEVIEEEVVEETVETSSEEEVVEEPTEEEVVEPASEEEVVEEEVVEETVETPSEEEVVEEPTEEEVVVE